MIINKIAYLVNNFIIILYSRGISFYEIIIGMFIFDFIIYIICKFLKKIKRIKF